jgi:hypothetical protein
MPNTKRHPKNHYHDRGVLKIETIRVLVGSLWRLAVPVLSRARDGVVTTANSWATWRGFIRQILTRPCSNCSGEGIVYWAVDGWHADRCEKCDGTGRFVMVSFF